MSSNHNLDITMYSFKEVLALFDLNDNFDTNDLKRAKHKVLMTHPDKSKLPAEYFLFYKKAFEIVYHFYEENVKQTQHVPNEEIQYSPMNESSQMRNQMSNVLQNMKTREFQDKFNTMFEKNMVKPVDDTRNDWFRTEKAQYEESAMKGNMSRTLDTLREQNTGLIRYNDVQTLRGGGTSLYEENDDDSYIQSDPFSKLKFDDLRKVHKDETIFSVSEKDYAKVKTYQSTEQLMRARGAQPLNPMEKSEAEKIMETRQKEQAALIRQKQYQSTIESMKNEEKSKSVLANFLRLTNS